MANAKWMFALRGDGSEALEIDIYDIIGESFWREGVSAKSVRAKLKENKDAKTIKLRVNSRGGDVIDGFAIYNLLSEHPARVEADVDALAASMASVILMAADEIRIASNGFVMIHNPWGLGLGEAEDLRATAEILDKMRDQIADVYVARTGQTRAQVIKMMADETWMTPSEAKALGFVDKVRPAKKGAEKKQTAQAVARLDLTDFEHVPAGMLAAVAQARGEISGSGRREPITPDEDDEESDMADELKNALATLGVASVAEASARLALLTRIEASTGKTGDEAQGIIQAALQSHAELPKLQARVNELETTNQAAQLDALIGKGKAENKVTPAIETNLRAQITAGDMTLKGAEAMLASLPAIAALGGKEQKPAKPPEAGSAELKWNGKTYNELTHPQRAELKKADPDLFESMRATFKPAATR